MFWFGKSICGNDWRYTFVKVFVEKAPTCRNKDVLCIPKKMFVRCDVSTYSSWQAQGPNSTIGPTRVLSSLSGFSQSEDVEWLFPSCFLVCEAVLKGREAWMSKYLYSCRKELKTPKESSYWSLALRNAVSNCRAASTSKVWGSKLPHTPSPLHVLRKPHSAGLGCFGPGKARSKRRGDRNQDGRGFEGQRTLGNKRKRMHVNCVIWNCPNVNVYVIGLEIVVWDIKCVCVCFIKYFKLWFKIFYNF